MVIGSFKCRNVPKRSSLVCSGIFNKNLNLRKNVRDYEKKLPIKTFKSVA